MIDIKEKVLNRYETLKGREDLKEKIIDCMSIVEEKKQNLRLQLEYIHDKLKLVLIQVGYDYASEKYFNSIKKNCEEFGISFKLVSLKEDTTQEELEQVVEMYGRYSSHCSVMIHTPLPKHIDKSRLARLIDYTRDVDCISMENLYRLFSTDEKSTVLPCTVQAVVDVLKSITELEGKKVVILGRGMTVGKPLSIVLDSLNTTVTVCHSKSLYSTIIEQLKGADIIISAIGSANKLKYHMISNDQILIDVGINYDNSKICGDIDFEHVLEKCKLITPVPFGIGSITSICLIENIILNYISRKNDKRRDLING